MDLNLIVLSMISQYLIFIYCECQYALNDVSPFFWPYWHYHMFDDRRSQLQVWTSIDWISFSFILRVIINIIQFTKSFDKLMNITNNKKKYFNTQKMSSTISDEQKGIKPRFSIVTNIRPPSTPISQYKISSLVTLVLMAICFILTVSIIVELVQKGIDKKELDSKEQESKVVNQIFQIVIINEVQKNHGLPPIPIIQSNIPSCEKTKKQQLQQSIKDIQIFELMKDFRTSSEILQKYFVKVQPLFSVKHEKFTSPHINSKKQILSFQYWSPFHNYQTPYAGIDKIFSHYNQQKWSSYGKYLTFTSDQPIKPSLLIMILPQEVAYHKTLYIYGISVIAQTLVNKNTLQSTLLKKTHVKEGYNKIECDEPACVKSYSMIMLLMDPVEIIRLELYSSSLRTWINFSEHG